MNKLFGAVAAMAAGAFVLGAQAPVAQAAPLAKPEISQTQLVKQANSRRHYRKHRRHYRKHHRRWHKRRMRRHSHYRKCGWLRAKAIRTGSRYYWSRYKACRYYR